MGRIIIAYICSVMLLASCNSKKQEPQPEIVINLDDFREPSTEVLKQLSREEAEAIHAYVKRHGWTMLETGTGVQIYIYRKGTAISAVSGDMILLDFEITLLDGTVCYSSKETGAEEFRVDYDEVESGLHEAVKYLHEGDKAIVIIPSHRAFGLIGDLSKIPPLSTVVYDLSIVKVYGGRKSM
jgi:FKBP-type peptidyl-prolyl cis-trans isomerase FkpA